MRWFCLFLLVCGGATLLAAQEPGPPKDPASRAAPLLAVIEPIENASDELKKLRKELKSASNVEAKQELESRIEVERERISQLRENFRNILGGTEAAEYDGGEIGDISLQSQISELIQPFLGELRDATSRPRELDTLRKSLDVWTKRKQMADSVVARIDQVVAENPREALAKELESVRRLWSGRQADASGQLAVITSQIDDREREKQSVWDTLSGVFSRFFRSRGLNLLVAVLVGVAGFIGTRRGYLVLRRYSPVHRVGKGNLTGRISDLLAMGAAVLVATLGVLMVFYIRGDWLLLTLTLVLLIGAAWAGKTALPPYVEQLRMMLNLGSVRDGERVVHLGLPWKVSSIGVFTRFSNPNLQGGVMRIPIRDLMTMTSREADPKEPWFPTECDDWALLSDHTYGKVITQTPEQVVFLRLGGSMKTFTTADFLKQCPEKLSHGFRISCTFGIDYKHQADAAEKIPATLQHAVTVALVRDFGREAVRSIKVEFTAAAASSLDYRIIADFDGSLASKYQALQRRIQKLCLEVCNAQGWVIPFTQITLHQAEE
jgi:predicted  nucleic acid-binding Zn-ribbon protein